MEVLDELDQRIVAALQVDGRASWRKIAATLREPERSVARRGSELLANGIVVVAALRTWSSYALLRLQCAPGTSHVATESLALRSDTTFSYLMTGEADVVAEIGVDQERFGRVLSHEIPATVGVVRVASFPILVHFRTVRGWRAPVLTPGEAATLQSPLTQDRPHARDDSPLNEHDDSIVDTLSQDGRAPVEALARRAGVSESTVNRRLEMLIRTGRLQIRALVEPARVGLATEALLWISTGPQHIETVGTALSQQPEVRYAVAIAGRNQLVADVTVADTSALYDFISAAPWSETVDAIEVMVLVSARKRGGMALPVDA